MTTYWRRLREVVAERGPLCVGIDPHPSLLKSWGLEASAAGAETCARTLVEALGDRVAAFKPQSAFFEAHGSAGIAALERVLADIHGTGAMSILDVKRGDIGSTMEAYADAYLADGSPLAADAITLSPYLGFGSLAPAFERAHRYERGVYVLARTSNPEGSQVQLALTTNINIMPPRSLVRFSRVLSNATPEDVALYIRSGETLTWPKIEMIRNTTSIGRTINDCLHQLKLEEGRELKQYSRSQASA